MSSELLIEVESFTGEWFTIHGEGAGDQGVYLGLSPDGIYDEPTTSIWNSHAFQTGASFGGIRVNKRDVVLGMEIIDTREASWQDNDSEFRKAWSYKKDSKLWIETSKSRRFLNLRISETPRFTPEIDPFQDQYGHIVYVMVAGDPRWKEVDKSDVWVNPTDTTAPGASFSTGTLKVWNDTNTKQWLKYTVQAYPGAIYRLPDFSFGQEADLDRYEDQDLTRQIVMPVLIAGEHLKVDTDPEVEQVVSNIDTQVWQRMNGVQFLYPIPPYTGTEQNPIELPVAVKGAPAGVGVQVRWTPSWGRPWGLE